MEKKNFVTLVIGVVGGVLFSLGMCMGLLPEWNMFNEGVGLGVAGAVVLLFTLLRYRKLSGKKPMKWNSKVVGKVIFAIFAFLVFGLGMSMVMVFEGIMLYGILVGVVGIVLLLCLIPMFFWLEGWKRKRHRKIRGLDLKIMV